MCRAVAAVALVGLLASAGCSIDLRGEESVVRDEKRFAVEGPVQVTVATFDGAVEMRSWDRNEVLIQVERRAMNTAEAQALEVRTTQEGARLTIEAPSPQRTGERDVVHLGGWRSPSVSFVITTPRRAAVDVRTGDGPIMARELVGNAALRSGDGGVRVERLQGDLVIETGDGPVSVSDLQGALDLNTGDGPVDASGRLTALRLSTGDGPVRLEAFSGSAMAGDWTVTTGDGPITVRLPGDFNAELDAYSGDGQIRIEGIGVASSTREDQTPAQFRTRLGTGGSSLRLRTGDGPITVAR
jgi:hypothetical protein